MINTITNRQMFFILVLALSAYSIIPLSNTMAETAGTGAWVSLLATSIIFMLPIIVIICLNNRFKGKMLFEYAPQLIGKAGAYLISIFYVLHLALFLFYLVTEYSIVLKADFFPETPLWVIGLITIPVYCYIAYKGVSTTARLCELVGIVFIITGTFVHIIMTGEGRLNRILPLFNPSEIGNYAKGIKPAVMAFMPLSILLAIPFTKENGRKAVKTGVLTMLVLGLFYVLIVESSFMKVGLNDIVNHDDSLIVAIRDTEPRFFKFLARLDILYLTVGFTGLFTGTIVIYTVILEFLCRMFKRVKRVVFSVILGLVTFGAKLILDNMTSFDKFIHGIEPFLVPVAALLIPSMLLIIAKVKKKGNEAKRDVS